MSFCCQLRVDLTGDETQRVFDQVLTNLARTAPPIPGFRRQKGGKRLIYSLIHMFLVKSNFVLLVILFWINRRLVYSYLSNFHCVSSSICFGYNFFHKERIWKNQSYVIIFLVQITLCTLSEVMYSDHVPFGTLVGAHPGKTTKVSDPAISIVYLYGFCDLTFLDVI